MKNSFKTNFDKWELVFTPIIMIFLIIFVYVGFPNYFPFQNYEFIFLFPSLLGNFCGLALTLLLDNKWKKIDKDRIMEFLRLPSMVLVVIAAFSSILITIEIQVSLFLIAFGLGTMISFISLTSLIAFKRGYLEKEG